MQYPIFVSPKEYPDIVIQLDSATCGRIILACKKSARCSGWFSPIGSYLTSWSNFERDSSYWRLALPEVLRTIPYMQYHYPEYLI